MKISTFIQLFLVIACFMIIFGLMSQEAKTYYPDAGINDSDWYGKYDYSGSINDSFSDTSVALKNLGDENKGWFVKILSGIAAIPLAIISLVKVIFSSLFYGAFIVTDAFVILGLPAAIAIIICIMILIWAIFKLIEMVQRWQI